MNKHKLNILIALSLLLSACSTSRLLNENEFLLKSNKIQFEQFISLENKVRLTEQLTTLYKQKPNRKFLLFFPREYYYIKYVTSNKKPSWISKTFSKLAEKPSLLDTSICRSTTENIYNYLYNQGYFNAQCKYQVKVRNHKANVSYLVNPGNRYIINNIEFLARDSSIQDLLNNNQENSFLKPGNPVDNTLFQNEKARISELLFNYGYAEFNPIYIQSLDIDTIHLKANVKLIVNNPENKNAHPKFKINKISVFPYYLPGDSTLLINKSHDSIDYMENPQKTFVKSKLLSSKINFRPGEITNKYLIDQTYNNLSKLGIYRFVNIEAKLDTINLNSINYNIYLTPYKKWVFDFGTDLNYTSIKSASKTLFGISGFVHLKNRNLFKGAESFSTKFEVGTELNIFKLDKFNSLNFHYSNELSLPNYYDITGSWQIARTLLNPFFNLNKKPNTRTNLIIGFDYENLVELYKYSSVNTNIEYEWQINRRKRISLHTLGFFLYLPKTTSKFDELLKKDPFLENSFKGRRLLTSFFLDNLTYYYQSKIKNNSQHAIIAGFNVSGFEVYGLNKLYNRILSKKDTFSLSEFEFAKFVKPEIDYRFYYILSEKSKLATRFSFGIVSPFGTSSSVPYIKQFYIGGPQSIRGWNIRELGPGNKNLAKPDNLQTYYAAGDIKIEGSVEFRFDIVWRLKGAFFVDAGNIWILRNESIEDQQGLFTKNFINDIALSTGLGIRFDLTYFIFRFDSGFKLRTPFINENNGSKWIYTQNYPVSLKHLFENYTLHLALDYPF